MRMMADPLNYEILSAMITPALFMTACGSLIISTSNRMSRIVDRIRLLNEEGDALGRGARTVDFVAERRVQVSDQLRRLEVRADRIRIALTVLYMAFAMFVGTSLTLALDVLLGKLLAAVPTGLAVVGVCLLLVACINLVREALAALRGNRLETRFYNELQAMRDAASRATESGIGRLPGDGDSDGRLVPGATEAATAR